MTTINNTENLGIAIPVYSRKIKDLLIRCPDESIPNLDISQIKMAKNEICNQTQYTKDDILEIKAIKDWEFPLEFDTLIGRRMKMPIMYLKFYFKMKKKDVNECLYKL